MGPIAHIYKQFLVRLIQRCVLLCNLIRRKKLVLRLCANFTTCLPAVYYNVFVTKKYPKPPYTLHTFKTHTEEERKLNEKLKERKRIRKKNFTNNLRLKSVVFFAPFFVKFSPPDLGRLVIFQNLKKCWNLKKNENLLCKAVLTQQKKYYTEMI